MDNLRSCLRCSHGSCRSYRAPVAAPPGNRISTGKKPAMASAALFPIDLDRSASDMADAAQFGFGLVEIIFRLSIQRLILPHRRQQVRYGFQRPTNLMSNRWGLASQKGGLIRLRALDVRDVNRILAECSIAQVAACEQHPAP